VVLACLAATAKANDVPRGLALQPGYTNHGRPGDARDPNSVCGFGNDQLIVDLRPSYLRLFVPWDRIQPLPPDPDPAKWRDWNVVKPKLDAYAKWGDLEKSIDQAKCSGAKVVLTIADSFPCWANGQPAQTPCDQKFVPAAVDSASPWGLFLRYLMERFDVAGIEIMNEPNQDWRPPGPGIVTKVSDMIQTAHELAKQNRAAGRPFAGAIFAPATSDTKPFAGFTKNLLKDLRVRHPGALRDKYLKWSHHNYRDIIPNSKKPTTAAVGVRRVLELLGCSGIRRPNVWLTEGGGTFTYFVKKYGSNAESKQLEYLRNNYRAARLLERRALKKCPSEAFVPLSKRGKKARKGLVKLWMHYQLNQTCNDRCFRTGPFQKFVFGTNFPCFPTSDFSTSCGPNVGVVHDNCGAAAECGNCADQSCVPRPCAKRGPVLKNLYCWLRRARKTPPPSCQKCPANPDATCPNEGPPSCA
jgi:hypothetical protein